MLINKWLNGNIGKTLTVFLTFFYSLCKPVYAEQYLLKPVVNLSELARSQSYSPWLRPESSPQTKGEYFIAQENGQVSLLQQDAGHNSKQTLVLDVAQSIPNNAFISLSAFAFHPNFSRPDGKGYGVFYTAHTGPNINDDKAEIDTLEVKLSYETIISAWQYDFDNNRFLPESRREVLRLPITDKNEGVKALVFDPYQKPWGADFGQLYIVLDYIQELKELALYSGAVLRISPIAYGNNQYTVPQGNPYLNDQYINDEIVLKGLGSVEQIFWMKNDASSIYLKHSSNQQFWLSKSALGQDYSQSKQVLWETSGEMPTSVFYRGQSFSSLRNHMVFFQLKQNEWQLVTLDISAPITDEAMVEQSFVNQNLSVKAQLSLYQGKHGQILVYDFYENILYMLALSDTAVVEDIQLKDSSGIGNFILVILILLLIGIAGIFSYRKSTSRKRSVKVLSKDHLRFNFKANQKLIQLFKGDKKVPFQTMNLDQISGYQLLLNGNVISAVSGSKESVMSNLKEKTIRDEFDNEHFHKLDEQETRQIEVNILTDDAKYLACLYFRKGNSRIIGGKYFSEVEHAIEFGWAVSMSLNAGDTEQREIKNIVIKPIPSVAARLGEFRNQQQINEPSPTPVQLSEQSEPNALLSGLDKLIELHKQGLLSDEEFRQAKAKLLQ